jgi:hypothetical protein
MNNLTTATAPLRASETVDVLTQQIMGNIRRDGHGQFYVVEPTIELVTADTEVSVRDLT